MTKEISDYMAQKLRDKRKQYHMSLTDLVIATGVSKTQLLRFYTHDFRNFTEVTFQKLWKFAYYKE